MPSRGFKFVKTQPESAECALGDYAFADSVAPFTGHCLRVREPSIQMTVSNSKRAEPLAFLDEWFCPGKMQVCHRLHLPLFVRIEVCQRAAQFSWYLSSPSHSYRSHSSRVAMFKRTPPSSASRARARIEVLLSRNSSKRKFLIAGVRARTYRFSQQAIRCLAACARRCPLQLPWPRPQGE